MKKEEILIFGAGALSLGFLGPELFQDYKLTFVDQSYKEDLLEYLNRKSRYFVNISIPGIQTIEVKDVSGLNLDKPEERKIIIEKIKEVSLIFTAVGVSNLKKLAYLLSEGIEKRCEGKDLFILCYENGKDVPGKLKGLLKERLSILPPSIKIDKAIARRMCRYERLISKPLKPVGEDISWGIVAEPFYGIPIRMSFAKSSIFYGRAFQIKEDRLFDRLWDTKIFLHNGSHAFLAYLGCLNKYTYFYELLQEDALLKLTREMLREVERALLNKYSDVIEQNGLRNYAVDVLRRILCPLFKDSIARGVGNCLSRLQPEERLILGAKFILSRGYLPLAYSLMIASAIKICKEGEKIFGNVDDILLKHCGLSEEKDGKLIKIIKENCKILEQISNSCPKEKYSLLYKLWSESRKNKIESFV